MLQVGIFGAGHLGKIHLQQWLTLRDVSVVGFYEPDEARAAAVSAELGIPHMVDASALIAAIDAADIVAPTIAHHELAKACLLAGKHVFIEKPLANTLEEGRELVKLVREANVKCQVGHVERYNPALLALEGQVLSPMFIEAHRLSPFHARGTDVAVILDLMIHDIDIVLHLVKAPVKRISASGVAVMSDTADLANARLEFSNGCVANLTASRISLKKMRKMRLFQRDAYIGIDFLDKKTEVIRLREPDGRRGLLDMPVNRPDGRQQIMSVEMPDVKPTNAIQAELTEFVRCIHEDLPERVSVFAGYEAMDVAHQIIRKMTLHQEQSDLTSSHE